MTAGVPAPPLGRIVATRIVLFAAIAMLGQLAAVLWDYASHPDDLARMVLGREASALAGGVTYANSEPAFVLPSRLAARYGTTGSGYAARIGIVGRPALFDTCGAACVANLLPDGAPPTLWYRRLSAGYPLSFVGGAVFDRDEGRVAVELLVDDDRGYGVWRALADEAVEHMVTPMTLTLIFVLGASLWSIRNALAPVRAASIAASRLDFRRSGSRLEEAGMPREVAELARAVNRSFERLAAMMAEQKLFTSAIAHEIRTPLAVIRLELDGSPDPSARKAIEQIDELSRFVEQMTDMARLEAADRDAFESFDLTAATQDVVASLGPWIYAKGASVAFDGDRPRRVVASEGLVKDAIRNLIENAVRHGGRGVDVAVSVEAGPSVRVADDGAGFGGTSAAAEPARRYRREGGMGIGLEIVRRIAAIHGGAFEIGPRTPRGTVARLSLGGDPDGLAAPPSKERTDAAA
jgi:signal transduction histidine kinase